MAPHLDLDRHLVTPGSHVDLTDVDTGPPDDAPDKDDAKKHLEKVRAQLIDLQRRLYAQDKHRILVIFQAIDTGGKDGAIKDVFSGITPAGINVVSFKAPNEPELDHDYLWRVHAQVPGNGQLKVFNRSHYEDVLVVRVHELVEREVWRRRYRHIRDFERMLADEGTTIIKFFLHISKDEQRARLQSRIDEPSKNWKFSVADLKERELWDDYQEAFADMLSETSTGWAPWTVVPADKKWYRNLVVASTVVDRLDQLGLAFPDNPEDISTIEVE